MKDYLQPDIDGRQFLRTYLLFFIPILILSVLSSPDGSGEGGMQLLSIIESYLTMLLQFAFFCYVVTRVTFRDIGFPFTGRLGEFAPKALLWLFLSTITLGLYGPWFGRNYIDYVLRNISWNGKEAQFRSQPSDLLKSMLLRLYLPVAVLSILGVTWMLRRPGVESGILWVAIPVYVLCIFLIAIPFVHVYLKWLVNFDFAGYRVQYDAESGETFNAIAGPVLLTIITLGIFGPAAWIRIYRFVMSKVVFLDGSEQIKGELGFDGPTSEGFGVFWGQILLTIITIGIYGPWAMARVGNWVLGQTYLEGDLNI